MTRVLNKKTDTIPPDAVYVGRPNKWGNPFKIGDLDDEGHYITRQQSIDHYLMWITGKLDRKELDIGELKGKDLVCWCAPLPCHADILLELANA